MTNVAIETSAGRIHVKLYANRAPKTVKNFLDLANKRFYNGLHFHRVIKDFMLQGGCPNSKDPNDPRAGMGGPGYQIKCEFHPELKHDRPGILSMANAGPNTGGSQFFLTTVETPWLDNNHAVFGEVTKGMEIVKQIESTKTGANDRPVKAQKIISIKEI